MLNKFSVSEAELNRRPDLSGEDYFDVLFLKKHLLGSSYNDLSLEYNISFGQIQIKLQDIMYQLADRMKIPIQEKKVILECLRYKTFWLTLIKNYEMGIQLFNNNLLFSNFLHYFKKQDIARKEFILKQLQDNL